MADVESLELQIKGNASGAKRSIDNLCKTLEKLEKATAGGCGLSKISTELQKIQQINTGIADTTKDLQKVSQAMNKFNASSAGLSSSNKASAKSFGQLVAKVTAAVYALKKGAQMVGSWINESNEYVENLNLFTVSMGEYAGEAQRYAEQVSEVMGIDPSTWMRSQGVFMTLATGFGVAGDRAATMSQQMTQLGYDLSSFFNIPVEEAMDKLKSGFSGELEPLRNLGYDLSKAKLEAIALGLGIDKTYDSMTQAEKSQLRYYAIMTQVTTAQGDMARTLDAPANQLRILSAQVQMAARSLGNIFIPVLNAILPYVIAAVKVIRLLANAIASLVGFTMSDVDYSGLSNISAGAGAASEELDKASGSAAKLNKTLLGMDELNVLSDSSSGGGGAGVGGGGGEFDFALPTYDFIGDAVTDRVNDIVEKMKAWLGLTGEIKSWSDLFNTNLGQILILVGEIAGGLLAWKLSTGLLNGIKAIHELKKAGLDNTLTIMAGATLAVTGFTIEFTGVVDAIKNGLDGLNFGEILAGGLLGTGGTAILGKGIASWIGKAFAGSAVSKALETAAKNLFGPKLFAKLGTRAVGAVGAALGAAIGAIIAGIPAFLVGIYDAIKNGLDWLNALLIPAGSTAAAAGIGAIIGMLGGPIGAGIGALIGLAVGLVTDLVILIVQNWESVTEWCSKACEAIGQFFVNLWKDIVSVWKKVATWFNTKVIQPVVSFFSGLWASVSGFFVNLWTDIVAIFTAIPGWFDTNVIQPVVSFFTGLWTSISALASDCWNAIVEYFSPAIKWFSDLFSSVWQTLSDIFYNIGVLASGCWEIIKAVWQIVSAWFNTNVVQPVANFFTQLWTTISTAASNAWNGIKNVALAAWNGIKSVFATISSWINQYIIQPVKTFFNNLWTGMQNAAIAAWNGIKSVYASVTNWFNTTIVQPVGTFFTNLWSGFINGAKSAWAGVKSVFSSVASFFQTTFQNAWAGVVKVFSVAGNIFVNIKDGITSAFKSVVNGLIGGLNRVISVPFNAINSALTTIKNIKILGLTPFSKLRNISVPSIPYLADGGMINNNGQLFVANESGPELVANVGRRTAVMNNDQIVDSVSRGVYEAVVAAMRANSDKGGDTQSVNVYLDGKQLYASMEQHRKERGASLMGNQVYSY